MGHVSVAHWPCLSDVRQFGRQLGYWDPSRELRMLTIPTDCSHFLGRGARKDIRDGSQWNVVDAYPEV